MKRGIVLLNLGGPNCIQDVKPFLYNLFSDPDILVGIRAPLRQMLAFAISQIKGPGSKKIYRKIGGSSPQRHWTSIQAQRLERELRNEGEDVKVVFGMRAWEPFIADALQILKDWEADEVFLFPLFPQFSTTTTGSCFKEARQILKNMNWTPVLREIRNWPDAAPYVDLLKKTVNEAVEEAQKKHPGLPVHVLFSAHSLPLKIIERGDPYPEDVQRTVQAATSGLTVAWSLAFQSRNGPVPWLKPYTEDEIPRLARHGKRNVVVVPVSFVSDHIETLYELDQLYADLASKHGIIHYSRSRSFNDDPEFIGVLKSVYAGATRS